MLKIRDLKKSYGNLPVLDNLSLEAADGEIVAVVGTSGCGKSTLLNIVAGIVPPDAGVLDPGGARVGYVFQEDRLLPWLSARDNVRIVGDAAHAGEVDELLSLVGLDGFGGYYPNALSGGMRQRVAIARAYHYRCDLLLMDEPFKSLDHNLRAGMLEALMNVWRARRNTVLFVTHDLDEVLAVASRVAVLGGRPACVRGEFALGATDVVRSPGDAGLMERKREMVEAIGRDA